MVGSFSVISPSMSFVHQLELDWILWFQGDGGTAPLMLKVSYFGSELLSYAVVFTYFCVSQRTGAKVGILLSLSRGLLLIAKWAFHLPRPYWIDPRVKGLTATGNFGMPSGHVLSASVVWPSIAAALRPGWARWLAFFLVLLVAVSRVYLGSHFVSDVAAAWCLGRVLIWFVNRGGKWLPGSRSESCGAPGTRTVSAALTGYTSWWNVAFIALGALLLIGLGLMAQDYGLNAVRSELWAEFASNARNPTGLFEATGEFLGVGCGWVMARRWAGFDASGPWWRRIVACVYAGGGFWLLPSLVELLPMERSEAVRCVVGFSLEAVKNYWLFLIAPWILLRIGVLNPSAEGLAASGWKQTGQAG